MGLLKVGIGAASSVLADSWREYFYCESLDETVLAVRAKHKADRGNKKGNDNVISNGSIIAVNDGQCMILVEQGKVVELSAEPGEFVYDSGSEPSLFYGKLSENIGKTFEQFVKRVGMGGEAGTDQRVYYFNTKELVGNKYGTANPVPFRVIDRNIGLDMDLSLRAHGEYSYQIVDPLLFYKEVCGNFEGQYMRSELDSQLKSEILTALQPALAKISAIGVRYSELPAHTIELTDAMNEQLSEKWSRRGLKVVSFGMSSATISEEDEATIKQLQRTAVMRDPGMGAANLNAATAQAMQDAAKNTATGPMFAFANMTAAQNMGMGQANMYAAQAPQPAPQMQAPSADSWTCSCGSVNTGKFCANCGNPKPAPAGSWTCSCGSVNNGKFCANCGKPKPADEGSWICSCGTVNNGKFCQNCGKPRA